MQVLINKASKSTLWYAEKINETFKVLSENEKYFEVINPNGIAINTYYIFKIDCKIIKK